MKKRVLFVGLTVIDIQYFVDEFPSPNQKMKTTPPLINIGGPAANAAITFSFLGGESTFLTGIGDNPFAPYIHNEFRKNNIDIIDFVENKETEPVIATIITSLKSSERSIISHYPACIDYSSEIEGLLNWDEYDLVFIDGFYPEVALPICKRAKDKKLTVVFDGGSWKSATETILPYIDIAICSEQFLPPGCNHFRDAIYYLQQKGVKKSVITRNEKSIQWSSGENINSIEVTKTNSIDSLGAGDVFHGAFLWFMLKISNFELALKEASNIATFSTRFKGASEWMKHFRTEYF